jgi:hypothetical protein
MKSARITLRWIAILIAAGAVGAGLVRVAQADPQYDWRSGERQYGGRWHTVPVNTPFDVRLDSRISTEYMRPGDTWTGRTASDIIARRRVVIPAGSAVRGVVTVAAQGTHNSQAELDLSVREVYMGGYRQSLPADTQPIVAGSHRAAKIGAVAGGALIGGIVGHEVSHRHGGLVGGLLGGAIGYGATRHAFRTLELKPGTVLTFTTTEELNASRF